MSDLNKWIKIVKNAETSALNESAAMIVPIDDLDKSGDLSPMSLAQDNLSGTGPLQAMDKKDEFAKWIKSISDALNGTVQEPTSDAECGCGQWSCQTCFPQDSAEDFVNPPTDNVVVEPEACPHCGESHADECHKDEVDADLEAGMDEIEYDMTEINEVDDESEHEDQVNDFVEKPASGKGVKLGDIVRTTEFRKSGGQESPLSYGEENLDEDNWDREMYGPGQDEIDSLEFAQMSDKDMAAAEDMMSAIVNMQNNGLSKSDTIYTEDDLAITTPSNLKRIYAEVTGNPVTESLYNIKKLTTPTLFEQMKWDEQISKILAESDIQPLEESSLSKLIGKQKGGQRLVSWLHKRHKLSNEADLQPAPFSERLLWKEYKRNPDNFIVVSASNGVAGIKPYEEQIRAREAAAKKKGKVYDPGGDSTLQYQIIAFTDDGQQVDPKLLQPAPGPDDEKHADPTVMKARMGKINGRDMQNPDNVFNLLAEQIGTLRTVYVVNSGVERDKMKTRSDIKKGPDLSEQDATNKIVKRIQPVLKTLATQSLTQINTKIKQLVDSGDFDSAQKLGATGNKLKAFISAQDSGNSGEIYNQVAAAASDASGYKVGTNEYKEFLNNAAAGNATALKPILDSLRKNLVA